MARILKQNVKRLLAEVPDDLVFRCRDGHTFEEKTDFGIRVGDTIDDKNLARDLWEPPNQTQADQSVASHITFPGTGLVQRCGGCKMPRNWTERDNYAIEGGS